MSGIATSIDEPTVPAARTRLGRSAWCWALFQGGRDPYVILITIYVFVPYLVTSVIADPVQGQALVAGGAKYAGWIVALTAPLLGAAVDRMGPRKPWLAVTVALMVPLIAVLWWAKPGGAGLGVTAVIAILAAIAVLFAYTETLHNALLIPAAGMALGPRRALGLEIVGVVASQLLSLGNTRTSFLYQPYDPPAHAALWDGPMFRTLPELGLIASGMLGAVTVTAAYASSRTMLTRVVPPAKVGIFFGLFVIAGSATMWLGPLLVQIATEATGSQRLGLLPISGLLLAGLALLQAVRGGGRLDRP